VNYAKTHNEGLTVHPRVTEKMRKFAWYKYSQTKKKDPQQAKMWKGIALTKKLRLTIKMPKRQFMGMNPELNKLIISNS